MRAAAVVGGVVLVAGVAGAALVAAGDGSKRNGESWEFARALSSRRSYVAAAQIGNSIYVAGGMVGETGRRLATFQRFDAAADAWMTLEPLPEPVRAAAGAALDGRVYVIGGSATEGPSRGVYAYHVREQRWRRAPPLPKPRFNHAAVALGSRLYVLGGFAADSESADVFVYEAVARRWSRGPSLPRRTHAFGAVAFDGEIWLIGGRRGQRVLDDVWILDPETGSWRSGPTLPRPMELLGATVAGREIHAVWDDVYQIYDATTGRWRQGPRPLVERHALRAFHVDGAVYTVGGCTNTLEDSPVVERRVVGN